MKVIFVNRFFYPDLSATSQILSDLAFALAGEGMEIHVVASWLRYDVPSAYLSRRETIHGVEVHRVPTTRFGRGTLAGRIVDYISFYANSSRLLSHLIEPGDIIVAKTDPPLISIACLAVARRRSARFINWVQDLYPETAEEMGVPLFRPLLGPALRSVRNRSLAVADASVAVGEIMAKRLSAASGRSSTTHVIPNWSQNDVLSGVHPAENQLRRQWDLVGKFVVSYSGNLGRAHEFATLLGAAERFAKETDLKFLFVGGGRGINQLKSEVEARRLSHLFCFQPYQPAERLAETLSAGDVHWLSLRPEFEGLIVPSKFYGILAVSRPVIAICAPEGELASLVEQEGCGVAINPGDIDALERVITKLRNEPTLRTAMGRAGRDLVDGRFSRRASHQAWLDLLRSISSS